MGAVKPTPVVSLMRISPLSARLEQIFKEGNLHTSVVGGNDDGNICVTSLHDASGPSDVEERDGNSAQAENKSNTPDPTKHPLN